MGKVFGYPEFDAGGEKILTTYDNEYKDMMMDIRVYRMKAGQKREFQKETEETAVLLLKGSVTMSDGTNRITGSRNSVFTLYPMSQKGTNGRGYIGETISQWILSR